MILPLGTALLAPLLSLSLVQAAALADRTLTVTVIPSAGSVVPQGAQGVPFLTLRLRASCASPVTVSSLTLRHTGKGAASDILRVYAYRENLRISRAVSVPTRNSFTLRLRPVTVPACGEETLSVLANFSSSARAAGEHRFEVTDVGTQTGVTVHTATPSAASPLRVTTHATTPDVKVDFRTVHTSKEYGTRRVVARFLLTGGNAADQRIRSITFTNQGSARNTDMRNLYVETASRTRISSILPSLDGDTARITLEPPLPLSRNQSVLLQLRADVRASRTRTIDWSVEEPSDIVSEEARSSRSSRND
ncbi:MAG: hypothetical protein WCV62_00010 [Candidatus Peribacteraceae bacterium]